MELSETSPRSLQDGVIKQLRSALEDARSNLADAHTTTLHGRKQLLEKLKAKEKRSHLVQISFLLKNSLEHRIAAAFSWWKTRTICEEAVETVNNKAEVRRAEAMAELKRGARAEKAQLLRSQVGNA